MEIRAKNDALARRRQQPRLTDYFPRSAKRQKMLNECALKIEGMAEPRDEELDFEFVTREA